MGPLWLQGPWRPVLGPEDGQHAAHAAGPQELCHLGGAEPGAGGPLRDRLGGYAREDLGVQEYPTAVGV
jgi:hypothetical protein